MKPIELKTPPEQTQTITRAIFDIVKEHGPLTIAETWDRVQVTMLFLFPFPHFLAFSSNLRITNSLCNINYVNTEIRMMEFC